jgi:hypothetical protein
MVTTQEQNRPGTTWGPAFLAFAVFALIAAGSILVAQRHGGPSEEKWSSGSFRQSPDGGRVEMVAVMRSAHHSSDTQAFRRAEMVTIAGHGSLDLSGAKMAAAGGSMEVVVLGGQATVRVPSDWAVVTKDSLTVGKLENQARRAAAQPSRTLQLEAVVLGGRLEVIH